MTAPGVAVVALGLLAQPGPPAVTAPDITRAWDLARSLAPGAGGPAETKARVDEFLARIDRDVASAERGATVADAQQAVALRYAATTVRAAIDAALDERDEMSLFLAQSRHLADQLDAMGAPANLPRAIDEVEGELWFEVDRYVESRDAFRRAVATRERAANWMGLGRAAARLKDEATACEAYRHASTLALTTAEAAEARDYLAATGCR